MVYGVDYKNEISIGCLPFLCYKGGVKVLNVFVYLSLICFHEYLVHITNSAKSEIRDIHIYHID